MPHATPLIATIGRHKHLELRGWDLTIMGEHSIARRMIDQARVGP